ERRRDGGGALLKLPQRKQQRGAAQERGGRPRAAQRGCGEESSDEDHGQGACLRHSRPEAEACELPAATVLLDSEQEARRAERASAHLEVPAVVLATANDRGARLLQ